jgi:threonine-phosphate decarboxylase
MYQYVHGGDTYLAKAMTGAGEILDFSVNINPLGLPQAVKDIIVQTLDQCAEYPDPFCRELVKALAAFEQTDEAWIFNGNGASELIFRLALAVKPQKALLLAPAFADYERALRTVNCGLNYYDLREEDHFFIRKDFLDKLTAGLDIVFICNPNNPTGQLCSNVFLKTILDKCLETNTLVVVDECFMNFVDHPENYSVQPYLKTHANLLILKAFTKIFAMAGLRLGYALTANTRLIEQLRAAGPDWNVSTVAQAAGITALQQSKYLDQTKIWIAQEREFLTAQFKRLGFRVFGSRANFIFFKSNRVTDLAQKLLAKGILIRSCANYVNLSSEYYRVAVKSRTDNLKLIAAIEDVMM